VWDQLAVDLEHPASLGADKGLWGQIGSRPAGLWQEAREETLLLGDVRQDRASIWNEANDETLILDRVGLHNLWEASEQQTDETLILDNKRDDVWNDVQEETLVLGKRGGRERGAPKIRDLAHFKPMRASGWALKELPTANNEQQFVLKNLRQDIYLRLDEQQAYVWNLMDGGHTLEDLAVAVFIEYGTFSFESLVGWLAQLRSDGFLTSEDVNVYRASQQQLRRRTFGYWGLRLVNLLFRSDITFTWVDSFYGTIYRIIGRMLFSLPVQILMLVIAFAGLPAFYIVTPQGNLSGILKAGGSVGTGIAGLIASEIIVIFVHESAHALTTKRYGRTVRRGGMGLYFGLPSFFMDTTDIWMEPRGPRVAVTWAGPYSGFVLGGVASLILLTHPLGSWHAYLYQLAAFGYFASVLNLNPLLKLDGYYILMDMLEMPRLRERSIGFVRKDMWGKLIRLERFSREERIFAVFGVLALAWTTFVVFATVRLYGSSVYAFILRLVGK
jgi:Zn-dependent protease